ncbi:Predicted hydrolase of the alpha/beta superfamily [Chitinophaga sp. CF118]|uniref:alpha/beta hydrolase-fold protein n=1 Tax=Chitinophaga sp. CF118 TaxID=1884367 RepID=UPI0008EF2321|nr:alpha/beta hydrolase-fold protein [Chitinophaga sp. CF118]SFE30571.1 Predicted hydrolase of the alpha/beta superfamily [Chitinophaga sp. CF118]
MKNKTFALVIILFYSSHAAISQEIIKDSIYSNILKEQRAIEVVLPDKYKPGSGERYEVTYVTDGEWNTKIVAQLQRFAGYQFMPPNIIVSLPNTYINKENMRNRDLTPTHIVQNQLSGGADNYIAFLKTELIPYIEKKYPTKGARTYHGGSLGGLFGLYTFFKEPELFQSYTLSDPAFWWDNGLVMKMASQKLDSLPNPERTLFFTGREGKPLQEMGVKQMDSIFRAKAPAALHWKCAVYNGETHNSMIFKTVYDGFKFTYEGYTSEPIEFHPMAGIVLKDKPFNLYCFPNEFQTVRYTTDGTEPTPASPKITNGITPVTISSQLIIKAFDARKDYDRTMKGDFTIGTVLPVVKKPGKIKPGGLDTLAGTIGGYIEIKEEGYYIFGLMHPSMNTKLSLGNQPLFDYDTATGKGSDQSYILPLTKGFYPIQIKYAGNKAPDLMYLAPGKEDPSPIPTEIQYH